MSVLKKNHSLIRLTYFLFCVSTPLFFADLNEFASLNIYWHFGSRTYAYVFVVVPSLLLI